MFLVFIEHGESNKPKLNSDNGLVAGVGVGYFLLEGISETGCYLWYFAENEVMRTGAPGWLMTRCVYADSHAETC